MRTATNRRHVEIASFGLLCLWSAACKPELPTLSSSDEPVVSASQPLQHQVTDYAEVTGTTQAVDAVDIKARVSGHVVKIGFEAGHQVKKGDLLFEIDPRPYQAQLDAAKAEVAVNQAQLKLATANYARAKDANEKSPGAISQQQLQTRQAEEDAARAAVEAAEAQVASAELELEFTKVTSPIDGRVSRAYSTIGNLVTKDMTLLTTVVSEDPIYAYFDLDERTMLQVVRHLRGGDVPSIKSRKIPVELGLSDEEGYPHKGVVDFAENQVDASTGTITVRGVFENPATGSSIRLFTPGMFVRIRLPLSRPHAALLVTDSAVGTDQGRKYVLVVDDAGKVQYRGVTLGALEEGGLRVVDKGLEQGDWVVVSGLQRARPGTQVKVEKTPMPVIGADEPKPPASPESR